MSRSTTVTTARSAAIPKLDHQSAVPTLTASPSRVNLSSDEFDLDKSEEDAVVNVLRDADEETLPPLPDSLSPAVRGHSFAPNLPFMKKKGEDDIGKEKDTKEAKKKLKEAKREEKKLIKETKRAAKQSRKIALAE